MRYITKMNTRLKKAFGEAYDKLYDLNSLTNNKFQTEIKALKKEAAEWKYEFKLNKRDKFKCVMAQ